MATSFNSTENQARAATPDIRETSQDKNSVVKVGSNKAMQMMMTKLQGVCLFLHCVVLPLLLIAGPACLLYLVQQCYTQKNTTFQQIVSHLLQKEERIEPNNTAHITTRIIQMLEENIENVTKEEKPMNQVENKTSIRDC